MADTDRPGRYVRAEQDPPPARRVTDQVVTRFEHVLEVDPALMGRFAQQPMPAWDTKRIVAARWEHLDDVHRQFADGRVLAGEGPDGHDEQAQGGSTAGGNAT
jgi:hypothetical protein